jgi:hypothetical protein
MTWPVPQEGNPSATGRVDLGISRNQNHKELEATMRGIFDAGFTIATKTDRGGHPQPPEMLGQYGGTGMQRPLQMRAANTAYLRSPI